MADLPEQCTLPIEELHLDDTLQMRVELHEDTLQEYAGLYSDGTPFPPVVVFHDGQRYWLADGFHRVEAARKAELEEIPAEIHQGRRRDAILCSVGADAPHGLRRTNADKRRAVLTLLGARSGASGRAMPLPEPSR
jgi:hypothetical protein